MRILHISTHDRGGAASAMINLHYGLLKKGVDSHCLFLKNTGENIKNSHYYKSSSKGLFVLIPDKIKNKFGFNQEKIVERILSNKPKGYEGYSFPITPYKIHKNDYIQKADIINLHFVSRFIDYPSFFPNVYKPLVWTIHDMNPFLGGFHYSNDEERFHKSFYELEKKLISIKDKALKNTKNLYIVSLSHYLKGKSLNSSLFNKFPHFLIQNSVDTDKFRIYNKKFSRDIFNLPQDKKLFLFVSESINNRRKGFDILLDVIDRFNEDQIIFCAIGKKISNENKDNKIYHLGYIRDPRLLALAYSASDAFILPSREDNLPNTMLEALSCGTPVLTFIKRRALSGMDLQINIFAFKS